MPDVLTRFSVPIQVLAVVLPLDEKKHVSSVLKPLDPVIVDLSDDDEDGYLGVSVKSPEKAFSKTNVQMINPQAVASVSRVSNCLQCICTPEKIKSGSGMIANY